MNTFYFPRIPWQDFPDVVLLAAESDTKRHPEYPSAKTGDAEAAAKLVRALVDKSGVAAVRTLIGLIDEGGAPVFASVHAYEHGGVNAIPIALVAFLGDKLDSAFETTIIQANIVCHTGADGYGRLARQARFEGRVHKGRRYIMVDDFVGQGGTLANLRGWIEHQGARVVGAVALTVISPESNYMNSAKNTDRTSKSGGGNGSVTPSTALLNQRLGPSPAPRMLTPYEIGLLRRSKKEMDEIVGEILEDDVGARGD